jgi:hypothetical protein
MRDKTAFAVVINYLQLRLSWNYRSTGEENPAVFEI